MPIVTYHPNAEVDNISVGIGSPDTSTLSLDDLLDKSNDLLNDLDNQSPNTDEIFNDLIQESELDKGGKVGRFIDLFKNHIIDMVKSNHMSKSESSAALVESFKISSQLSMDTYFRSEELKIKLITAKISLISDILKSKVEINKAEGIEYDSAIKEYTLKVLMPLDREIRKESIEKSHTEHDKLLNEIELLNLDKEIKEYYKIEIQPNERISSFAKAAQDSNAAGSCRLMLDFENEMDPDFIGPIQCRKSIPNEKINQLSAQTDLYVEQKDVYKDKRQFDVLKVMMNYQAMIYPDVEDPLLMEWTNNENTKSIYEWIVR